MNNIYLGHVSLCQVMSSECLFWMLVCKIKIKKFKTIKHTLKSVQKCSKYAAQKIRLMLENKKYTKCTVRELFNFVFYYSMQRSQLKYYKIHKYLH